MQTEKKTAPMWVNQANRRGAEYNLESGLDWARIRAEYEANATPRELVRGEAAAKGIQKGKNGAECRLLADAAELAAFGDVK